MVETGGANADSDSPNVSVNMVPKEGGNQFRFNVSGMFTNHSMQSSNLTDEIITRGITEVPKLNRMYDAGFTVGGPIKQDKVWFFAAIRRWGTRNQAAGLYWNKTQGTPFYTPDTSRPAYRDDRYESHAARITWQVSERNKLNMFTDIKHDCICESGGAASGLGSGATNAQEGEAWWRLWPNGIVQATWTSPRTNKLLLEAGASMVMFHWPGLLNPGTSEDDVAITEQSTNFRYNNVGGLYHPNRRMGDRYTQRFAASYVTGSHAFKTGIQIDEGYSDTIKEGTGLPGAKGVSYVFNRGVPVSVRYDAIYHETYYQKAELGIYAQDQWTKGRATFNMGLRFDYYNGYIPAVREPAHDFTAALEYPAVHGAPVVEGYRSPAWICLRPVRRWPDRGEGLVRPLRGDDRQHAGPELPSVIPCHQYDDTRVDRCGRRLLPRLRPEELRAERRVWPAGELELRQIGSQRDRICAGREARDGASGRTRGTSEPRCSTS